MPSTKTISITFAGLFHNTMVLFNLCTILHISALVAGFSLLMSRSSTIADNSLADVADLVAFGIVRYISARLLSLISHANCILISDILSKIDFSWFSEYHLA